MSSTIIDNTFIDTSKMSTYTVLPLLNGLSDHNAQLLTLKDLNLRDLNSEVQWRTDWIIRKGEFSVVYPGIFFEGRFTPGIFFRGGGSTNSVEVRVQRERESGGSSPLVRGSTQFANE
jgi:hypothetical protein